MPNQLSFEVEFSREQILDLFKDPEAAYLVVSGTYIHNGGGVWKMVSQAEVLDKDYLKLPNRSAPPTCIQPCPRG